MGLRTYTDGYVEYTDSRGYMEFMNYHGKYVNLEGEPIERTPDAWPYNYDEYVLWRGHYNKMKAHRVYSDRMQSWDSKKWKEAWEQSGTKSGAYTANKNPHAVNRMLNYYFGKEVKLTAILQGCNQASGFPYWVYIYENIENKGMVIKYCPHRMDMTIGEAIEEQRVYTSREELLDDILKQLQQVDDKVTMEDLSISEDKGKDNRMGWKESRNVCTTRIGGKVYDTPQCIGYCSFETGYKED